MPETESQRRWRLHNQLCVCGHPRSEHSQEIDPDGYCMRSDSGDGRCICGRFRPALEHRGGELGDVERILVTEMIEALEKQQVRLYRFLLPMRLHRPETHQLEGALKSLDIAIGLLRASRGTKGSDG